MNRKQAVDVVKEVSEHCNSIWGKSIQLLPNKENNAPLDVEIHFEVNDDVLLLAYIMAVARANKLAVKKTNGTLVVYSTQPNDYKSAI
jgi:hypothetical protein